jgi:pSer/pThr/pTyr-binding forkhead associated (FHA) protein
VTMLKSMWNRISSAFERRDIAAPDALHDYALNDEDPIRPTTTRYATLREAVERRVQAFLRHDLVSHLEIGYSEIFVLHYIEIAAADSDGADILTQFLREFSPAARVRWVKRLLGTAVGRHVALDEFLGLDTEFTAEELSETDPFEERLHQGASPLYRVTLHGRWENRPAPEQPATPESHSPAVPHAARSAGPCLRLSVNDAKSAQPGNADGTRTTVEVGEFPAVLGSSVHADVEITGYYVSARHCTLHWDGHEVCLADHSTNGTWVNGERVHRGNRVALANGALVSFGRDTADEDHARYPAMRVKLLRTPLPTGASATPVSPSRPTPVAPALVPPTSVIGPENTVSLAVLAIADVSGNPSRDVLKLPFTIGRGSVQDYVVPDANQGVSREHLIIEEINGSGAVTVNRAASRNGTFAGNHALPDRFVWRFGEEIVLGERWTSAPTVRITLQHAEQPA